MKERCILCEYYKSEGRLFRVLFMLTVILGLFLVYLRLNTVHELEVCQQESQYKLDVINDNIRSITEDTATLRHDCWPNLPRDLNTSILHCKVGYNWNGTEWGCI